MAHIDRKDFVGFLTAETRRGGKRYLAALPNGEVLHYKFDSKYGISDYTWSVPGAANAKGMPFTFFTKRGARRRAWKEYWRRNYSQTGIRVVG